MNIKIILAAMLAFAGSMVMAQNQPQSVSEGMTNERLDQILRSNAAEISGVLGRWEAYVANRSVFVITDTNFNRMRIISPITESKDLGAEQMRILLEANFDKALDSKYSIFNGVIWSTFTHPLRELTDAQFVDALQQVVNLANNYGTTFMSTDHLFGGDSEPEVDGN